MPTAKRFPRACVASPHHLASSAGLAALASGGNALDAAIAANLTLGVVTPYACGYGGDLFAMVWHEDRVHAYNGSGRAPAAATVEAVRKAARAGAMPERGPLTVTVPGAVDGWFALIERFGTRTFADLAGPALAYAEDGFAPSEIGAAAVARARRVFRDSPTWEAVYGEVAPGRRLRQPDLAKTIALLAAEGPDAYYRGPIGVAIARHVASLGGLLSPQDLAAHRGDWVAPLRFLYRDVEVLEMPPNSQGMATLEALGIVAQAGLLPGPGPDREHLLMEATKLALADRDAYVTDPSAMSLDPAELISPAWLKDRHDMIDPARAGLPRPGRPTPGGTAYLCAADETGMVVSLIQSNYMGFGSGLTVPGWGVNLHNRGTSFSLDPAHPNTIGPGKRTMHTVMPAMALRQGRAWLAFGSMGGHGQPQTHLQLLARMVDDGEDPERAIDGPRWMISPSDWSVTAESRFAPDTIGELRSRGHAIAVAGPYDSMMGHANVVAVSQDGYLGATDPRTEGAALGL